MLDSNTGFERMIWISRSNLCFERNADLRGKMSRRTAKIAFALLLWSGLCLAASPDLRAQAAPQSPAPASSAPTPSGDAPSSDPATMFPHSESSRFWISGQVNIITQWHPAFRSPYQGPNSLSPEAQDA